LAGEYRRMHGKGGIRLISVDIGTTSAKAVLYRQESGIEAQATESCTTFHPRPGYVEQDPEELLAAVTRAISRLVEHTRI
jgi:sugar (pentulose or hexulose) kinase